MRSVGEHRHDDHGLADFVVTAILAPPSTVHIRVSPVAYEATQHFGNGQTPRSSQDPPRAAIVGDPRFWTCAADEALADALAFAFLELGDVVFALRVLLLAALRDASVALLPEHQDPPASYRISLLVVDCRTPTVHRARLPRRYHPCVIVEQHQAGNESCDGASSIVGASSPRCASSAPLVSRNDGSRDQLTWLLFRTVDAHLGVADDDDGQQPPGADGDDVDRDFDPPESDLRSLMIRRVESSAAHRGIGFSRSVFRRRGRERDAVCVERTPPELGATTLTFAGDMPGSPSVEVRVSASSFTALFAERYLSDRSRFDLVSAHAP